jgi:hypothetical protein
MVDALRDERIRVVGPAALARALRSWSRRSEAAQARNGIAGAVG